VADDAPPAPPTHLTITPDSGELTLNWAANTEPDLAGYLLAYRPLTDTRVITAVSSYLTNTGTITDPNIITDTRIISYTWGITETMDVGNVIHYTLLGLDDNLDYAITLRAYDLSGNLSAPTGATAFVTETTSVVCTTPFTLETPPVQTVTAGESVPITLTVRTTAQPSDSLCDFIQVSGQSPFSEAAQVYIEQSDLYLFTEGNLARTRALLYAPPEAIPGDYTVTFRAVGQSLTTTASTSLSIVPGVPHTVTLHTDQDAIPGDGISSTTISATVTDANGYAVADGTEITFVTNYGTLSADQTTTANGVAQVTLTSGISGPVTATVRATAGDAEGHVDVAFLWSDILVAEARTLQTEIQPDDTVQFAFAYGNAGNEDVSDVSINAVLPEGLEHVRFNSLGLMPQQTGDTPYWWAVPMIEAKTGGWITVTAQVDPQYNWSNGQEVTVPITIDTEDNEFTEENNYASVQWMIRLLSLDPIGDKTVTETERLTFTVSADAPEATPPTLAAEPLPPGASFDPATGLFSWVPDHGDAGLYTVTFTATVDALTDSETISITVMGADHPPVLAPIGDKIAYTSEPLTFTVSASDPDGTQPIITATPLPRNATFLHNTFSWTPDVEDTGVYTITFIATSDHLTDTEAINITVQDTRNFVYLPLILRNYRASHPYPMIETPMPEIAARPVSEQGETFYTEILRLDSEPPLEGRFYFSSDPDQIRSILVDDQLALLQNGQEIFSHTFSKEATSPAPAIVEVPRQIVTAITEGNVTLEYRDVYGDIIEASEVWLIWSP
jgi:uncharacterized repeat protein (TIGR01451 family)